MMCPIELWEPIMPRASLPLFEDLPPLTRSPRGLEDRHLQAARQLSRRMARLPDQSPEQLRAGQLICRHLIAMLQQTEAADAPTQH
jgi:hypothetical protein